jgi:hypothetical protein
MRFYEVECRAVITLAEQDMEKAALHVTALFKDNPYLIHVRAVHEKNLAPSGTVSESSISELQRTSTL